MKTITAQDMAQLIHNIADKTPTFIYQTPEEDYGELCRYKHGPEEPGCLIGHVLHELGLLDYTEEGYAADTVLRIINKEQQTYFFTEEATDIACEVQRIQDSGQTWGSAATAADGMAKDSQYWHNTWTTNV